jgi:two-component system, OmpR family, response regulator CpxR
MNLNISSLELLGKNIVIIEDDQPSIRYYEAILTNTGADVKIFRSGKEFIDYLADENIKIDLIFIDFLIPLINGIECVRIFRKERKSTPVVMITAYSSELARKEAFLAGCNEYLLKPLYPEKVFYLLDKYLRSNISATYSS